MSIISDLFRMILNGINSFVGNYGVAVVLFTILVRIVLLPLDIKTKKSMRAMTRIQPKVQELQAKYGKDQEKLNQKTMELYKKEKISPMAGCLPLLIQLPILWFMFAAMREVANEQTVKMILDLAEQAKQGLECVPQLQSFLWIKNVFQPDSFCTILPAFGDKLSAISAVSGSSILTAENIEAARAFLNTDTYQALAAAYGAGDFIAYPIPVLITTLYITLPSSLSALMHSTNGLFILPVLAGASQWLMTRLTGNNQAAQQQQGMGFMNWFFPIFSIWICMSYNAAFSLYWVVSNLIAMVQQLVINKVLDAKDKKAELEAANQQ